MYGKQSNPSLDSESVLSPTLNLVTLSNSQNSLNFETFPKENEISKHTTIDAILNVNDFL